MDQPTELRQYLEMCKRMGVRYLSAASDNLSSTDPVPKIAPDLKIEEIREDFVSEPSAEYAFHQPKWMTLHPETVQAMELTAFDRDICECQKCPLGKTRKNFVFGSGNPKAEVLFVGEAPGADETNKGYLSLAARANYLPRSLNPPRPGKDRMFSSRMSLNAARQETGHPYPKKSNFAEAILRNRSRSSNLN